MSKQDKCKKIIMDYLPCVVLTVIVILAAGKLFAIILISPDDVTYKNIMSGVFTGEPDGHCYFIQYPLAAILAFLYRISASVEWYEIFLFSCHALCFFLIFCRVKYVKKGKKCIYLVVSALLIFAMLLEHAVNLEWTVTAGILGATALFRYVTISDDESIFQKVAEYFICGVLLILCFCLRHTVAYMYIPLAGICWLRKMHQFKAYADKKKNICANGIFGIGCILAFAGIISIHEYAYSDPEWQSYKEYTKDRSALFDYYGYPYYDEYSLEYEEAGISREAYELMMNDYNFVIPCNNFEDIDLGKIADLAKEVYQKDLNSKLENTYNKISTIMRSRECMIVNLAICILFVCICVILRKSSIADLFYIYATAAWMVLLSIYLAFKGRFPERVAICIGLGIIAVWFGYLYEKWKKKAEQEQFDKKVNIKILYISLCIILTGITGVRLWDRQSENADDAKLAYAKMQLSLYCQENSNNIYFRDFWSFSQRGDLFLHSEEYASTNYIGIGGWTYNSPLYNQKMEYLKCTNLLEAIRENNNVYYLVNEQRYEGVSTRLNQYFYSQGESIEVELMDIIDTECETVYVLHFVDRKP